MISAIEGGYVVASVSYAVSTAFPIKLPERVLVPIASALVPAVIISGTQVESWPLGLVALGPICLGLVVQVARRSWTEAWLQSFWYAVCFGALSLTHIRTANSALALALCLFGTAAYAASETCRRVISNGVPLYDQRDWRTWWLLLGVLISASGLTVLVVERLAWPTFIAMVAVLGLVKREFEDFARSRVTYEETVRALGRLDDLAVRVTSSSPTAD